MSDKKKKMGAIVVPCAEHGPHLLPVEFVYNYEGQPKQQSAGKSTVGYSPTFAEKWARTFGVQRSDGAGAN